ncbi:MAG: hypothetical protein K9M56_09310 [Victivallales bacterium]|nr:hypothetical protein [Victivallales bacterium]
MKILIADKFQEAYLDGLNSLGHDVTLEPGLTVTDLPGRINGYDVLIVRSTKVTKEVIEASDSLNLIIRAGAGVNTIDVETAAEKGIFVTNTPGKNSIAVAELTMGLILSLDRNIPANVIDLRNGRWNKKKYTKADGLYGKKIGIIGLGEIGLEVAGRARAFGLQVIVYDPIAYQNMKPQVREAVEKGLISFTQTREEMLKTSDIVTIHVPSNPHTQKMVNRDFLECMKKGAFLINTSRGDIVVDEELIDAMNKKNIKAGLDVYNNECATASGEFETELSKHPNVIGTHHIGASTVQAQNAIAEEVIKILENFEKGIILNPVNIEMKAKSRYKFTARMFDEVGALEAVLGIIKKNGINVEKLETMPFIGEKAQYLTMNLDKVLSEEVLDEIKNQNSVIKAEQKIYKFV